LSSVVKDNKKTKVKKNRDMKINIFFSSLEKYSLIKNIVISIVKELTTNEILSIVFVEKIRPGI
tara:strand:- start:481 stop:672 length:192 start_codon:yes stop_codon:yes gene_type:complete